MTESSAPSPDYSQLVHDTGQEAEAILFDPDHFEGGVVESGLKFMRAANQTSERFPVPGSAVLIGGDRGRYESRSKGVVDYYELPASAIPMPPPSVALMKARDRQPPHSLEEYYRITVRDPFQKPPSNLVRQAVRALEIHNHEDDLKIILKKDDGEGVYTEALRVHKREKRPATIEEVQIAFDGLKGFVESHNDLRDWEKKSEPIFAAAASAAQAAVRSRPGSKARAMFGQSARVRQEALAAGDAARRQAYHEEYNKYRAQMHK